MVKLSFPSNIFSHETDVNIRINYVSMGFDLESLT